MIRYQHIQFYLLAIAFCLLPFNALPVFNNMLGEATGEGALYPLAIGSTLYFFNLFVNILGKGKLKIKNKKLVLIVLLFLVFVVTSLVINFPNISTNYYLDKSGWVRALTQLILLVFSLVSIFYISETVRDRKDLYALIKITRWVFVGVVLFATFQFFVYYFDVWLPIYKLIGRFIYEEGVIEYALKTRAGLGLHSVSQEPSFLSMYLAVILPFIFLCSGSLYARSIMLAIGTVLIFLTWSRSAYAIFLLQICLVAFLFRFHYLSLKRITIFTILFIGVLLSLILTESKVGLILLSIIDVEESGSSAARLGAAYSALMLWLDGNVLLGVGLGQAGYYLIQYLPDWAFLSNDTYDVVNELRWPPIHNFWLRLLSEVGIIGACVFSMIFLYLLFSVNKIIKYKYLMFREKDLLGYAVLASLVGTVLLLFNRETISNMVIWVSMGIALSYLNFNRKAV